MTSRPENHSPMAEIREYAFNKESRKPGIGTRMEGGGWKTAYLSTILHSLSSILYSQLLISAGELYRPTLETSEQFAQEFQNPRRLRKNLAFQIPPFGPAHRREQNAAGIEDFDEPDFVAAERAVPAVLVDRDGALFPVIP